MLKQLLEPEIKELILEKEWNSLRDIIVLWQEVETADLLSSLKDNEKTILFRILPHDYAADVFSEMLPYEQELLVENLKDFEIQNLLEDMEPDDRTSFLEELPADVSSKLLSMLKNKDREIASWLLGYPEYSVGRLMTPEYIAVRPEWTVEETFEYIRSHIEDAETYTTLYVVSIKRKLLGSLSLRKLFFTRKDVTIDSLSNTMCPYISAYDEQEEAVEIIKKYNIHSLAVVDKHHCMLGIVTVDDILSVASEEYTEDFHKMAGITQSNDSFDENIKIAPLSVLYKKRIPWLLVLVFVNIFSGAVINIFEGTLQKHIVLVSFLPLLICSGGNAGSQSATLVIRSLAVGNVEIKDWFNLFMKEIAVSVALALSMCIGVYFLGVFRGGFNVALVVSLSMFSIVVIGSLIGVCLPFILTRLNIDPAISGASVLTSICDIIGTAVYCIIATILFIFLK